MRRVLLVTNDFPPRAGGIQSYLHALAIRLPHGSLVVYASDWPGAAAFDAAQPFPVVRDPSRLLLPVPSVTRRAVAVARGEHCDAVWFGAAAPLGLLASTLRRQAGIGRVVACTHGHEVGWAMVSGGRAALRRIGAGADVVTTVSRYTRSRVAAAFGPLAALEPLPPGVDAERFRPDPAARAALRRRYRLGDAPVVTCVSRLVARKGQDTLVWALPTLRRAVPGTRLLIVGGGPHANALHRLARRLRVADAVLLTGPVPSAEVPAHHAVGDVFALPCRTRGSGLDVEGLGIALLEASAAGRPVVAGSSGGAPEAVRPGVTGEVVDGRDPAGLARVLAGLLADPDRAAAMGRAGRAWMRRDWRWDRAADRLAGFLGLAAWAGR